MSRVLFTACVAIACALGAIPGALAATPARVCTEGKAATSRRMSQPAEPRAACCRSRAWIC